MVCSGKKWGFGRIAWPRTHFCLFFGKRPKNLSEVEGCKVGFDTDPFRPLSPLRLLIMFIGEYAHQIDEKGRLAVPVKFRLALAEGAVVTRGLDTSLFLFPKEEWEKLN